MRYIFSVVLAILFCGGKLMSQTGDDINLDEQKVGAYTLPPLFKTGGAKKGRTISCWQKSRRPEILSLYKKFVYGQMPSAPKGMHYRVSRQNDTALNGTAVCKQVTIYFTPDVSGPFLNVLLYLPKKRTGPCPVFIGLNFYGNQSITTDTSIVITNRWVMNNDAAAINNHKAGEASRGLQQSRWPAEMLIEKGYGLATAYYGDLEPDHEDGWKDGIRSSLATALKLKPEKWSAIGAWGWGLSRMLDYLQTEPAVDAKKVIVTGHSRLGKAALWAGACDTRFAAVVSNNSGEGGAALARRNFGETILRLNTSFPHWFVQAFKKFNGRPEALPVDQHMLLSLVAPRPLYVASAFDDNWADQKGEFLAAFHAGPIYNLFGKKGLGVSVMPPLNHPVGATVRYHIRSGKHDITGYDWEQYIQFANALLNKLSK